MTGRWIFALVAAICACEIQRGSSSEPASGERHARTESVSLPSDPQALAVALGVPVDSLRSAGEERYWRDAFDSAQAIWRVDVRRARAVGDKQAEARTRMWIGLASYRLSDYPTARREGETSLRMKREVGLDGELSRSFNALGLVAWNEGRYPDALENFDSAITTARRHNDAAGIARATVNIPLVQIELGDYNDARRGFILADSLAHRLGDDRLEGNALANLGMLEIRLGHATAALPQLALAREHYRKVEYSAGEANALGQFATAWAQLGDLQKAIAAADTALTIARREGMQQEAAAELEVLADLHAQAGNPRLALMRLQEADSIDATVGLIAERGTNLRRMSSILAELGEAPASVARARAALAAHRKVDAKEESVNDLIQLSRSLSIAGDVRAATAEADSAVRLALQAGNRSAIGDAALAKAQLALKSSDPDRALNALRDAPKAAIINSWQIEDLRAQAFLALGQLDDARVAGERAVSLIERERASLGVGPLRTGYLQSRSAPFSNLIAAHLARRDTAAAFSVAASLAGRDLTDRLGEAPQADSSLSSIAEGEQILLRIGALERDISGLVGGDTKDEKRLTPLSQALDSARASYEEFLARSARLHGTATVGASPITLAFAQSRLADDEALVVFVSGPDRLNTFVVRRGKTFEFAARISDRDLALRVRVAREILGRERRGNAAPPVMSELYEVLLAPAADGGALDGVSRLLVIPHGSLGALPFGALWNRRAGKFLVEEFVIRYLASAATLAHDDAESAFRSGTTVFAPIPDSLPGTRLEAEAIARTIAATLRIGSASTESGVRSALGMNRSIHIASHGLHNSQNPLFSRMTVGKGGGATASNDGRLEVHEILGLRTRSPLVFLSGCETGLVSAADGVMAAGSDESSLAQAFLIAGAKNVVATLWRVDDKEAVQIATLFYRHLRQGSSADEALTLTQRETLHIQPDYTWAAYTISGGGSRAPRKTAATVRTTVVDR